MDPWQIIAIVTTALTAVIGALWRLHLQADADDRAQRDEAIAGWRDSTAAVNRLAEAIEKDTADRAKRHRETDR